MLASITASLEKRLRLSTEDVARFWQRLTIALATLAFVLIASVTVAFDDIFVSLNILSNLQVGDVAPQDIVAPPADPFISEILTRDERTRARESIQTIFDPPDPNIARQQTQLAQQILEFINNVRRSSFDTLEQKKQDLDKITALTLSERTRESIINLDEETWNQVETEITNVLPRIMRESIRTNQLQLVRDQLSNQVSVRFNTRERDVIVAITEDLVRPNTFENPDETASARTAAEAQVEPIRRSFVRGETIVNEGERITATDYEALQALGLLRSADQRPQEIVQAFLAVVLMIVLVGLYLARFQTSLLYNETRMLSLIATLFLMTLILARFLGVEGDVYAFPFAALALLYVAISGPHIAIIGSLGLALLVGLMANNSLEIAALVAFSGLVAALSLRRAERLNTFFVSGLLIGLINAGTVGLFGITSPSFIAGNSETLQQLLRALLSGTLLVPATAITVMYVVTWLFNLPTTLKLLDLSQPNKPLLQRLLREAPGTYQHSLMVGNLASQAANAIGADAQLVQVAALYHDIGKMNNPIYFAENQQNIANPHDTLNDPYRSADIIISHITEGDEMARQYRLPNRIRNFIREHHGTTQVFVFFKRAIANADDDEAAIDIEDFTYPGPRPRTRETAILMLADSCESAVRASAPDNKQEISKIVHSIVSGKRDQGQLDDSGLTLNDLHLIQRTFVEILQGVFHPRVNYQQAIKKGAVAGAAARVAGKPTTKAPTAGATSSKTDAPADERTSTPANGNTTNGKVKPKKQSAETTAPALATAPSARPATKAKSGDNNNDENKNSNDNDDENENSNDNDDENENSNDNDSDEAPLPDVPRLPSADKRRVTGTYNHSRTPDTTNSNGAKADDNAEAMDTHERDKDTPTATDQAPEDRAEDT